MSRNGISGFGLSLCTILSFGYVSFVTSALLSIWIIASVRPIAFAETAQTLRDEQEAIRIASDFAQRSVVQVESFGGREVVDESAVAAGPSSGTVVGADGWIVTSLFQFRGDPASITVLLSDGTRKAAKLVARDYAREFALLKIDVDKPLIEPIVSPKSEWLNGQWAIALGKTFDTQTASRSVGILSATDRIFGRAIQTDCKVSPHNYGGPLIDIRGRVLGILAPIDPGIATEGEVQQWYDSGIGFAIPIEEVLKRLPKLQKGEDIYPGKAGIRPSLNDDFRGPVILAGVAPGTPAFKAGLKAGDKLLKVNDTTIQWPNHIRHALGNADAQTLVNVTVERDGKAKNVDVELVKELPVYRTPFWGILPDYNYQNSITQKKASETDSKVDSKVAREGVRVAAILDDAAARLEGLRVGMILRKLNGEPIKTIADLDRQISFLDYREKVTVEVSEVNEAGVPTDPKSLSFASTTWPEEVSLQKSLIEKAIVDPKSEKADAKNDKQTGIVNLVMGDVKNQAFLFVPSNYQDSDESGLLVVLAEPGRVDRKAWVDAWEVFCRNHRYMIAVVSPADPEKWSIEELEIVKRTLQDIRNRYSIDPRRLVIGGVGGGSLPALILGAQSRSTARGIWISAPGGPKGIRVPQAEPMESPAFLFQGEKDGFQSLASQLQKLGYRTNLSDNQYDPAKAVGSDSLNQIQAFCASLEWK